MSPEHVSKILAKVGYTLLVVQSTERAVKRVMRIAMPNIDELFTEISDRLSAKEMDRPLGAFLTELRKKASLHDDVDALLRRFLLKRNEFIHAIATPDGWTLKTLEGLRIVNRQLDELLRDAKDVRTIFLSYLWAWKVQGEMETTEEEDEAFRAIKGKYDGGVMARRWEVDA
jgi:hypothetical protein